MPVPETVGAALQSIAANKLRAGLTVLGIVIGVAAVITMVALGSDRSISSLGARLLSIYPGQVHSHGVASELRAALTVEDARALERGAGVGLEVVPEIRQSLQVKYGNQNLNVNVVGTSENFLRVKNYLLHFGRMFTRGDGAARRRVAVLGSALPELLGVNAAALVDRSLFIRGIPFQIVGVLHEKGAEGSWSDPDEQILIPLQTAQYRVFGSDRLRSIGVQVAAGAPLEQAMVEIERVLRREHGILPGEDNDFRIRNRGEVLATRQEATRVFSYLLGSIAGVSLLVGGIGIMNIMLVSVVERTREIGIRKALGATRRSILAQFLVEAVALCLVGGLLGIALGGLGAVGLARIAGWNTFVSPGAVALAFGFSAAVGLCFGLWPARRAARLSPVEALRHE
jgi:putative ABC transport system permease protein